MRGMLILCGVLVMASVAEAEDRTAPTFRQDVMAVLSHSGCNLGTCHGNAKGKGGLKLTLRGDDPQADEQEAPLLLLQGVVCAPGRGGLREQAQRDDDPRVEVHGRP